MKITQKNFKCSITLNAEEYIKIATQANKTLPHYMEYDIDEIEASMDGELTITQDMLDEDDFGFFMWSNDFWSIISKYANTDEDFDMEVQI
jgi:hypothetical protein